MTKLENNQNKSNGGRGGRRVGAGRKPGSLTKRTREAAEKAAATGQTPLEVMLDNMRHFQRVAVDAEAVLSQMTADDVETLGNNAEEQFKAMLAKVKQAAGLRQMAQDSARDAAPYIHARLAAVDVAVTGNVNISHEDSLAALDD